MYRHERALYLLAGIFCLVAALASQHIRPEVNQWGVRTVLLVDVVLPGIASIILSVLPWKMLRESLRRGDYFTKKSLLSLW